MCVRFASVAGVEGAGCRDVEGHDAEARGAFDLTKSDAIGFFGCEGRVDLAVGCDRDLAAEDGIVEGQRLAGLGAEIEVGGGGDGHVVVLAQVMSLL